ncbi:hypothetical protein DFH09DRAFT_1125253 [Mycena vulgaris]|nr:hypothetical protein DFH09DRAFT_1125253 [Mycena vulgaris]
MLGGPFLYAIALLSSPVMMGPRPWFTGHAPISRCDATTCPGSRNLTGGTSTTTDGPITVSFTGNAVYVSLGISGECTFNLDGADVGRFNDTRLDTIQLAYFNASVSIQSEHHVLIISPAQANTLIEFDSVIIAYVGLVVAVTFAVVFLRRRHARRKLSRLNVSRQASLDDDVKQSV